MDVLCSDKTGTITNNELEVATLHCYVPYSEAELLDYSFPLVTNPLRIPSTWHRQRELVNRGVPAAGAERVRFVPFDPATKRSEGFLQDEGKMIRVVKGAPQVVQASCADVADSFSQKVEGLAAEGSRVLAVAAGPEDELRLAGLIALRDPLRGGFLPAAAKLADPRIRVLMLTGDGPATAGPSPGKWASATGRAAARNCKQTSTAQIRNCDVFAHCCPKTSFSWFTAGQQAGTTVGMTGDGVNDVPALKQAEVGIAVASATDVAKAAASLVLTSPGLANVVAAVETSRRIYQRMLTYTLNKIVKTFEIAPLFERGLMLTGVFVTTPKLIVLLPFTNDLSPCRLPPIAWPLPGCRIAGGSAR